MLTTLEFAADEAPENVAEKVREVWQASKVIHIKGPKPSDLREYYWQFFEKVGEPLALAEDATIGARDSQRSGNYWAEVRYDPAIPNAYRHTANAQPLHTDGSYDGSTGRGRQLSPTAVGTGFLGCVAMPENGGATTFIDAADLVEVLREENPELLDRLSATELPHARSGDRRVEKVIRYNGDLPLVNWNYYCVDPEVGEDRQKLREDFFHFLQNSPGVAARLKRVKLAPGDGVLWKDDFVLHGRDAFDPERTSARFLWKSQLIIDA